MRKTEPLYEKIYGDVLNGIKNGTYLPGSRLPSEKELSISYDVSRITSKKALEKLAEQDLIIRMPGKGSFVKEGITQSIQQAESNRVDYSTTLIGVIMDGFGSSFGCEILLGIESECKVHNLSFILKCSYGDKEEESKAIQELLQLGAAGIIIMCVHDENYNCDVLKLVVDQYPVVAIDRGLEKIPVSFVGTDNKSAARELTQYLVDQGYKEICFVSPDARNTPAIMERNAGFLECCQANGVAADESMPGIRSTLPKFRSEENMEKDKAMIRDYILSHQHIKAYFAVEYELARLVQPILRELKLDKVCCVVCFDDINRNDQDTIFTHVSQRENDIGATSVKLLVNKIRGDKNVETILLPYDIIIATD